jgi:signal transduction histidine kinase
VGRRGRLIRLVLVASQPVGSDPAGGDQGELRSYFQLNLLVLLGAVAWLIGLRLWAVHSHWVDVLIVLLVGLGICFLAATAMLDRHRHVAAVVTVAVSNWAILLAAAAIEPYAMVILPLFVLLPTLLAAQHLNSSQLAALLGATVAVATVMAAVGRLHSGVGLQALAPSWVLDAFVIVFLPISVGLFSILAWQAHGTLMAKAEALRDSRVRLVAATDRERRRIERNLHDGAQQRLVTAAVQARVVQRLLTHQPLQASTVLNQLTQDLQDAAAELRDLAHGIYPPQLTDHGLEAALRTAALRSPLPTTVHAAGIGRYQTELEVNVYFCCLEALQNASKHAGEGARVTISLHDRDGLSFDVDDTGVGCQPDAILGGYGFTNMRARLDALGGTLTVRAQPGNGVHIHGNIGLPAR